MTGMHARKRPGKTGKGYLQSQYRFESSIFLGGRRREAGCSGREKTLCVGESVHTRRGKDQESQNKRKLFHVGAFSDTLATEENEGKGEKSEPQRAKEGFLWGGDKLYK